ncbi:MAG: hypothetical protein C4617_02100 [Candidatus Liberibacter europaeus]|uniref:Flagellar assembly protein FliH/Type III secretion system HrpE domain-containing protein n=1 Tax=Candidatus Liberibacter europaeus TaxID=744859 RepID=A0A2T4VXY5_9HYPH|nr:hypothetical protein [Candidatus Liberibacter europaeus]PTL86630.1 MAG: hypothetical protein C4617_02100 [Candidatus Liberibacter europaeus]
MMETMLSRLEDFSQANSFSNDIIPSDKITTSTPDIQIDSMPDIKLERDKSYQEGYEAAIADQELYWKSEINSLQISHRNEIVDLRESFAEHTSEYISVTMKDSVKLLLDSLEHEVGRALGSILDIGISRKAAIELGKFISDVLKKGECGVITIHGPKNLHPLIQQRLAEYSSMVRYEDTDQIEFSTQISGSVITTRLESWSSDIKKILE